MNYKIPLLSTLLLVSTPLTFAAATSTTLTYSYTPVYSGSGGQLTITNNGTTAATLLQLSFVTNAVVTTPWGSLWGDQSQLNHQSDPNGIDVDYTIKESPAITIAAGQTNYLLYNIDGANGPFAPINAAMNPVNITVTETTPNPGIFSIPIAGACPTCKDPGNGKRILAYYPDWAYWRTPQFTAAQLPYDKINTVAYAFSIFDANGNISLYDSSSDPSNLPIIAQARLEYPYLNASLSFGGWSWASTPAGWTCQTGASPAGPAACFSQMAANPQALATFITKAVQAMIEVHFNGIDIDWEYPQTPADAANYVTLLTNLRTALNAQGTKDGTHYYLTIAAPAGIDKINALTTAQWQTIAANVDTIDVMTYDFYGAFDPLSDFMSAMKLDPSRDPNINNPILSKYDITDALAAYKTAGVAANQLVVGIPVYGRMSIISSAGATQGLYQPITGVPQGEWDTGAPNTYTGMVNYNCIVDQTTCGTGYTLPPLALVEPTATNLGQYSQTPWGYSSSLFITYDDVTSTTTKANLVESNGYDGVMLWDLSGDFPDSDPRSLVNTVYQIFNTATKK